MLEALLLERFLRHDEILIAEAHLLLREWKIITVLRVFVRGLFTRANLPIFPFILFGSWLNGVFIVFGTVRSVIFSCAGVAVFAAARFRAAPLTPTLLLYLRRVILNWFFLVIATILFWCIHHVYVV